MQLATPQGSVTLRQAQLSDVENFRTLRLEALRNHPAAFSADYELNAAKPMSYWEERIGSLADQGAIYFAEHAQSLIGMCGVQRDSSPKTLHTAWIWGVYVVEEWRGLRIAETLIEECTTWAKEHGATVLKLGVATTNISAIRCYQRCGFSVYGEEPQAIQVDGRMYAELLMVKFLA